MYAGDEYYGDDITSETIDPMDLDRDSEWEHEREDEAEGDEDDACDDACDDGLSDVEADAMTLASCGWGTDEDYGYFGGDD